MLQLLNKGWCNMENIYIAICDDESIYRDKLKKYIRDYFSTTQDFNIVLLEYANADEFMSDKSHVDLLLLDIDMGAMSGIELKDYLQKEKSTLEIVFISNHDELVLDAFGKNVLGFIPKSKISRLDQYLTRLLDKYQMITIGEHQILISNIYYLEGIKGRTKIVTIDGEYNTYLSMKSMISSFDEHFVQIHKSYVVNMGKVDLLTSQVILTNKQELPVGRKYKEEAKRAFLCYKMR